MKINKRVNYILIWCLVVAIFCGSLLMLFKPQKSVSAIDIPTIDENTEITESSGIISSDLHRALTYFYNANKTSGEPISVLKIDTFKNFPISTLDLTGGKIDEHTIHPVISDLRNLDIFDFTSFDTIILKNNKIKTVTTEFDEIPNLVKLDISNNQLSSFSYSALSETCYTTNLQVLNLSQNKITSCNLQNIAVGEIDLRDNQITSNNLTLPTSTNVKVNLSHNLLQDDITQTENIVYGFQGVKNEQKYNINQQIFFGGLDGIDSVKIYSVAEAGSTLLKTLNAGEKTTLPLGNYLVKFSEESATEDFWKEEIKFSIIPLAPTIKLFVDNQEIESTTRLLNRNTTIKFYGDENSTIFWRKNGDANWTQSDTAEIDTDGITILYVKQVVDGFESEVQTYSFTVNKSAISAWIFLIIGIAGLVAFFFIAVALSRKYLGTSGANKTGKNLPLDWHGKNRN